MRRRCRLLANVSVAAISGLEGATEGIRAVESRSIAGKIIGYPVCRGLGLVRLEADVPPTVFS